MANLIWNGIKLKAKIAGNYLDGSPAISVTENGEPYAIATVYIQGTNLGENECCIKNYSENAGIFPALIEAGIIEDTGKVAYSGWITAPIAKILI